MRTERDRDHRSGGVPRPHPYADKFFAKVQHRICDGVLEREKQPDDFRQTREFKVQVRKSAFLGTRLFRGHGREKQKAH